MDIGNSKKYLGINLWTNRYIGYSKNTVQYLGSASVFKINKKNLDMLTKNLLLDNQITYVLGWHIRYFR